MLSFTPRHVAPKAPEVLLGAKPRKRALGFKARTIEVDGGGGRRRIPSIHHEIRGLKICVHEAYAVERLDQLACGAYTALEPARGRCTAAHLPQEPTKILHPVKPFGHDGELESDGPNSNAAGRHNARGADPEGA